MTSKQLPHSYYVAQCEGQAQYAALCTAEDAAGAAESRRFRNLNELCVWLNRTILRSEWWAANGGTWYRDYPGVLFNERLDMPDGIDIHVVGRGKVRYQSSAECDFDWFNDGALTMWLPPWSWRRDYVIHEVAHFATRNRHDQHGPLYARQRLEAQYLFAGKRSGDKLDHAYREYGIKVTRGASKGWRMS